MKRNNPFNSKLIQHTELIRDSRKQGLSYVKIAKMLKKEHMLKVAPSTIYSFVKVRSKKRKVVTMLEENMPPATIPKPMQQSTPVESPNKKQDEAMFDDDIPALTPPDFMQEDLFGSPIGMKSETSGEPKKELSQEEKAEDEMWEKLKHVK